MKFGCDPLWQVLGSVFEVRLSFHNKGDSTAFDVSFNDANAWPKDKFEVRSGPAPPSRAHTHDHTHTRAHAHTHTQSHTNAHARAHTHTERTTHAHNTRTRTHKHTHTHTNTRTHNPKHAPWTAVLSHIGGGGYPCRIDPVYRRGWQSCPLFHPQGERAWLSTLALATLCLPPLLPLRRRLIHRARPSLFRRLTSSTTHLRGPVVVVAWRLHSDPRSHHCWRDTRCCSGKDESADKIVGKSNVIHSFTMNTFLDSWSSFFIGLVLRWLSQTRDTV